MYATLETYEQHDIYCPMREHYEESMPKTSQRQRKLTVDTPELRRKRRGGMGIDSLRKTETREGFTPNPDRVRKPSKERKDIPCKPYDPELPYRYMFDPRYNKYPYDPDYQVVDGEDYGQRYLNVPAYSYPASDSTTRVLYCDAPPKLWEFCDDAY